MKTLQVIQPGLPAAKAVGLQPIVFATDFSPASEPAFRKAIELARKEGAELIVAHVFEPPVSLSHSGIADDFIEAQSEDQEPFGFEALEKLLESMAGPSPAEIQDEILRAVARHAGERRADDDRTVMILRFDQLEALHTRAELMGEEVVS